jgi:hypothetical protein
MYENTINRLSKYEWQKFYWKIILYALPLWIALMIAAIADAFINSNANRSILLAFFSFFPAVILIAVYLETWSWYKQKPIEFIPLNHSLTLHATADHNIIIDHDQVKIKFTGLEFLMMITNPEVIKMVERHSMNLTVTATECDLIDHSPKVDPLKPISPDEQPAIPQSVPQSPGIIEQSITRFQNAIKPDDVKEAELPSSDPSITSSSPSPVLDQSPTSQQQIPPAPQQIVAIPVVPSAASPATTSNVTVDSNPAPQSVTKAPIKKRHRVSGTK